MTPLPDETQLLEYMYRDSGGKLASYREHECWGHVDDAQADAFNDMAAAIKAERKRFRFRTGALGAVVISSTIRVDDVQYRIIDHVRVDDGAESDLFLQVV